MLIRRRSDKIQWDNDYMDQKTNIEEMKQTIANLRTEISNKNELLRNAQLKYENEQRDNVNSKNKYVLEIEAKLGYELMFRRVRAVEEDLRTVREKSSSEVKNLTGQIQELQQMKVKLEQEIKSNKAVVNKSKQEVLTVKEQKEKADAKIASLTKQLAEVKSGSKGTLQFCFSKSRWLIVLSQPALQQARRPSQWPHLPRLRHEQRFPHPPLRLRQRALRTLP